MSVDGAEAIIANALLAHLGSLDTSPAQDIAYPNVDYTPQTNDDGIVPYLRATILPATTISPGIAHASAQTHSGLLQIDVFWPRGQGVVAPLELANTVRQHFVRGLVLQSEGLRISVPSPASVGRAVEEPDRVMIPVTIPWRCHVRPAA